MSAESSGNSDSGQLAAVRVKPQANGAGAEPQTRRDAGQVKQARDLIFGGGKSAGGNDDSNRSGAPPSLRSDEGSPPGPSNRDQRPARGEPERRPDATEATRDRPALDLDDDDEEDAPKRRKRSKTLSEYATEKELDPQELYALAVPLSDDPNEGSMTLGEMKDRVKEVRDFERRRDDFEDYRNDAFNELATARQQVEGVMARIAQVVPPEDLARAFNDYQFSHQQQVRTSLHQLREWFPEWDDAQVKARDRQKLDEHLATYGFTTWEVENLVDARLIRYAMHAMKLMERYKRLKDSGQREKVPTVEAPSSRKHRRDAKTEARNLAASGDVVGGVSALLR